MDNSNQKPTTSSNTAEAVLSTLLSSENQAQNSFFVFGNVYVNNQNEKSSNKNSKDSQPKDELTKSVSRLKLELNSIIEEMKCAKEELQIIKENLEMEQECGEDTVFIFGSNNVDNGFNFAPDTVQK